MNDYIIETHNLTKKVWKSDQCFPSEYSCEKGPYLRAIGTQRCR